MSDEERSSKRPCWERMRLPTYRRCDLRGLKVKELRAICQDRKIRYDERTILEKEDLVQLIARSGKVIMLPDETPMTSDSNHNSSTLSTGEERVTVLLSLLRSPDDSSRVSINDSFLVECLNIGDIGALSTVSRSFHNAAAEDGVWETFISQNRVGWWSLGEDFDDGPAVPQDLVDPRKTESWKSLSRTVDRVKALVRYEKMVFGKIEAVRGNNDFLEKQIDWLLCPENYEGLVGGFEKAVEICTPESVANALIDFMINELKVSGMFNCILDICTEGWDEFSFPSSHACVQVVDYLYGDYPHDFDDPRRLC